MNTQNQPSEKDDQDTNIKPIVPGDKTMKQDNKTEVDARNKGQGKDSGNSSNNQNQAPKR